MTIRPARFGLLTKSGLLGPYSSVPLDYHQDGDTWVVRIARIPMQPNPPEGKETVKEALIEDAIDRIEGELALFQALMPSKKKR